MTHLPPSQAGYTLPQAYYTVADIFHQDLRLIGETQWQLVDHASRIPRPGDYFLFDYGNDSIIVVRDRSLQVRAFYNVCRHRGSRIALQPEGRLNAFSCPYHAWTYDLTGALRSAMHMPADFTTDDNGLVACHLRDVDGLLFLNLSRGAPPDFDTFIEHARPVLALQQLANAKVAARRLVPNAANWKLVVENFLECYHCKPAHPLLSAIHDDKKLLAFGAGPGSGDQFIEGFAPLKAAWEEEERQRGGYVTQYGDCGPHFQAFGRIVIGRGNVTESEDGLPVAPSMIRSGLHDGTQIYMCFNAISFVLANSDYALLVRFTPRGPQDTDVEAVYLVRGDAEEGRDYDVERVTKFWHTTLGEDKKITQDNQYGVNSAVYRPGRYSLQEQRIADFTAWYRRHLDAMVNAPAAIPA